MPGKPLRFLSVCRLEENKRIDWMLRSLAALEAREPPLHARKDWRLDVVGEGSREGELRAWRMRWGWPTASFSTAWFPTSGWRRSTARPTFS